MKTLLLTTTLALLGATQAQQADSLYVNYARAAVKMQSAAQSLESLRLITDNMGSTADPSRSAAKGLICSVYAQALLNARPEYASQRVEVGYFTGTVAQLKTTCEETYRAVLPRLPKGEQAQRVMADIGVSSLMTEYGDQDGSNEDKVIDMADSIQRGYAAEVFLVRLAQFQLLLDGSPQYRKARIDVSSRPIGTGEWVLNESRTLAEDTIAYIAEVTGKNSNQATAEQNERADAIIRAFSEIYETMLKGYAEAEQDYKNTDYEEASKGFYSVSSALRALTFKQDDYLNMGINTRQIQIAGKTMTFEAAVRAAYALSATALKREAEARAARVKQREQLSAAWAKATAATLKGDRMRVYKFVGVPNHFTPNYTLVLNLANVQNNVNILAKTTAWHYEMYFSTGSDRYTCHVTYTFNGNKLSGTRITADPAYTGYIQTCQQRYTLK